MVMFCVSVLASVRGCAVCGELVCRGFGAARREAHGCAAPALGAASPFMLN